MEVALRGLEPGADYEVSSDRMGHKQRLSGAKLMKALALTLEEKPGSDLVCYRKVAR